jgi:hypothetical protein
MQLINVSNLMISLMKWRKMRVIQYNY